MPDPLPRLGPIAARTAILLAFGAIFLPGAGAEETDLSQEALANLTEHLAASEPELAYGALQELARRGPAAAAASEAVAAFATGAEMPGNLGPQAALGLVVAAVVPDPQALLAYQRASVRRLATGDLAATGSAAEQAAQRILEAIARPAAESTAEAEAV